MDPTEFLELAKAADKTSLNAQGPGGQTPLVASCLQGNDKIVKKALELGADIRLGEKDGYTVLHAAAFQARRRVMRAGGDRAGARAAAT